MRFENLVHWFRPRYSYTLRSETRAPAEKGAIERMEEGVFERLNTWHAKQVERDMSTAKQLQTMRNDVDKCLTLVKQWAPIIQLLSAKVRAWEAETDERQRLEKRAKRRKLKRGRK